MKKHKNSKKNGYYLKLDIEKFYPKISLIKLNKIKSWDSFKKKCANMVE